MKMNDQEKQQLIESWTELLLNKFIGLDWWWLSNKFKRISAEETARLVALEVEMWLKEKNNA